MCFFKELVLLEEDYREEYIINKGKSFNLRIHTKSNAYIKSINNSVEVVLKGLEIDSALEKLFSILKITIMKTNSKWIFKENYKMYECKVLTCSLNNEEEKKDVTYTLLQTDTLIEIENNMY
ncbi:hypothetical protein Q3304_08700 [Clostridioides sp. GD02377]|uniref:hypothetical protein n=1 Tax=unclassified Clostridioides TaxID=2635829 RepID=UPI00389F986A